MFVCLQLCPLSDGVCSSGGAPPSSSNVPEPQRVGWKSAHPLSPGIADLVSPPFSHLFCPSAVGLDAHSPSESPWAPQLGFTQPFLLWDSQQPPNCGRHGRVPPDSAYNPASTTSRLPSREPAGARCPPNTAGVTQVCRGDNDGAPDNAVKTASFANIAKPTSQIPVRVEGGPVRVLEHLCMRVSEADVSRAAQLICP